MIDMVMDGVEVGCWRAVGAAAAAAAAAASAAAAAAARRRCCQPIAAASIGAAAAPAAATKPRRAPAHPTPPHPRAQSIKQKYLSLIYQDKLVRGQLGPLQRWPAHPQQAPLALLLACTAARSTRRRC